MLRSLVLGLVLAGGLVPEAQAQETVGPCRVEDGMFGSTAICDVTNETDTAIATLQFSARALQVGRTVPWATVGEEGYSASFADVPGGIEPGETIPVRFKVTDLPPQADQSLAPWQVLILEARDVNGAPISFASASGGATVSSDPGPPMTGAERDAFRLGIQAC